MRLNKLYRELEDIPDRIKAYNKTCKDQATALREQIAAAWEELLGERPQNQKALFEVHHGERLVGHGRNAR